MKIRICLALLLAFLAAFLVSCGDDKEDAKPKRTPEPVSPYVGLWECDPNEENYLWQWGLYTKEDLPQIEIRADHTIYFIEQPRQFEYTTNPYYPDRLRIKDTSEELICSLNGDVLTVNTPDEVDEVMIFRRRGGGSGLKGTWEWDAQASEQALAEAQLSEYDHYYIDNDFYEMTLEIRDSWIIATEKRKYFGWDADGSLTHLGVDESDNWNGQMFINGDYLRIDFVDDAHLFLRRKS